MSGPGAHVLLEALGDGPVGPDEGQKRRVRTNAASDPKSPLLLIQTTPKPLTPPRVLLLLPEDVVVMVDLLAFL